MKIAVLSDFHFGFSYSPELENDSFENAEEAIEKALDCDLILLAGDVFDSRIPKTSVWAKALKVLVKPLLKESLGLKLVSCSKELKDITKRTLSHLPVVAIHGTHERRGRDEVNALQALENAGILIYLHQNTIVFEKEGKRVAVHGMSGVPERYAKDFLYSWNPKPLEDCFNILLIHQSIEPYVYSPLEPPTLNLSNLPKGFDIIIDGHVHSPALEKIGNTLLIFPGSTIVTQFEKNEALAEKGIFKIEINEQVKVSFEKLEKIRRFFYEEVKVESFQAREQVEKLIRKILEQKFSKLPLIRIKVIGKETDISDQDLREIEKKFSNQTILNLVKQLETQEIAKKVEFLRDLREQKLSVEEIGLTILKKNLEELGFNFSFDPENVFDLLSEGETEKVFNVLIGEQKTLEKVLKKPLEAQKGLERWAR
ncbi:MAG: DNA repair exonuclease [Candidatus Aenigmatarchaeota archaeon]